MSKKHVPLKPCVLCDSNNLRADQVGWAWITCLDCGIRLSKNVPLKVLVEIWNKREMAMPVEPPRREQPPMMAMFEGQK